MASNGPASGNWRDRRFSPNTPHTSPKRPSNGASPKPGNRKKGSDTQVVARKRDQSDDASYRRRSPEALHKDADVVVVDTSVLVHGLDQIKTWSRNGREEVIIVPLEGTAFTLLQLIIC